IDVAEQNIRRLRTLANAGDVIQNPPNLEPAEISGQRQAGLGAKTSGAAGERQFGDILIYAGALPDESVIVRVFRFSVPLHGRFTLIGDPDCGKIAGPEAAMVQGFRDHLLCPTPDLGSVVLHPSWLRKNLFVLFLRYRNDSPGAIEYD